MTKDVFANLKLTPGVDQRLFSIKEGHPETPQAQDQTADRVALSRRAKEHPNATANERAAATRARTNRRSDVRPLSRVSHDLFDDQVLWLNRLKLDIREDYNARITSNEVVRLAVELIWADYRKRGDDSDIVRVLVGDGPWPNAMAVKNGGGRA